MANREEQRRILRQWKETGRELERIRREELRDMPYDWRVVDALLQLGEGVPPRPDNGMGMVEMQRKFMLIRDKLRKRE